MIPTSQLRKAAEDALAFLRTQDDIEEAEAFVASNGQMLCRLNYTSHIPSNGLEEPKSTESYGIGLRVVLNTPEGHKASFGSEGSDISLEGVREALAKARNGAVLDPEFTTLPRATGERRTLSNYHDPMLMRANDDGLVEAGWQVIDGSLRTYMSSEDLLAAAEGGDLRKLGLIVSGDVTILQERIAVASYAMPRVQMDESSLIMSFITSMVERRDAKGSGYGAAQRLAELAPYDAGRDAAEGAIRQMDGVRVGDGEYKIIFGPQAFMDILSNLIVPGLNLGLFYAASSPFQGKLGQQIASEKLNIYDDGAAPGLVASKGITCEGLPTGRTELIRNGALVGLMANWYESQRILRDPKGREKLGVDPDEYALAMVPRNGFRFGTGGGRLYDRDPGISGTNIVVEGDGRSLEELAREVSEGLYVGRLWYTYPVNGLQAGDFTCTVIGDSYLIKDGRLAEPVKPNTIRINDNINNILQNVIGIGNSRRPALIWAADEVVHTPEVVVSGVHVQAIAGYMEQL